MPSAESEMTPLFVMVALAGPVGVHLVWMMSHARSEVNENCVELAIARLRNASRSHGMGKDIADVPPWPRRFGMRRKCDCAVVGECRFRSGLPFGQLEDRRGLRKEIAGPKHRKGENIAGSVSGRITSMAIRPSLSSPAEAVTPAAPRASCRTPLATCAVAIAISALRLATAPSRSCRCCRGRPMPCRLRPARKPSRRFRARSSPCTSAVIAACKCRHRERDGSTVYEVADA